ncbi:unnamed protein product [Paramecium pentaurelia]|uniref:Uncharacterized protein n=1 Tax=Paramecium pentaurelia TaxID=43138 RepID=A0A8S1UKR4_9CILI|nr:unnamed protein product [Paramecium pentaurelia]
MIILILVSVIYGQLEQLRETELGSTLLETVQLHIQADEPTGDLLQLLNGINEKLVKQRSNMNKLQKQKLDECMQNVESFEELIAKLKENKYDVREEIYAHKPHIEQYQHMMITKIKEKELLLKNIEICQNRENQQKEQYHKLTIQLQERRYDYVNQKNPLSLKIDQQSLKPLLNDLIDFTTDMMSLEDKYFDEKEQQTTNLISLYQSQLDNVINFLNEIKENIDETEHLVKQLELEYNEINHRINLKQEQVNDIKQECKNIFQQTKHQSQHISNEIEVVNTIIQLIEHNFGWLRSQLGL